MTGVGFACLTICARSLWGGRGVGPASQNRLNLLSRRCGPGGGVAFVFILALALRVCLLLCWRCVFVAVLHLYPTMHDPPKSTSASRKLEHKTKGMVEHHIIF